MHDQIASWGGCVHDTSFPLSFEFILGLFHMGSECFAVVKKGVDVVGPIRCRIVRGEKFVLDGLFKSRNGIDGWFHFYGWFLRK